MKLKPLIITIVVLGAIVGASFFFQKSKQAIGPNQDERVGQTLIAPDDLGKLSGVTFMADGHMVQLKKAGDDWLLPDYFNLPVNFQQLHRVAHAFKDAKVLRKVTSNQDSIKRLGMDSSFITFKGGDDHIIATINLGSEAESGGRYIRFNDSGPAYLTEIDAYLNGSIEGWVNKKIDSFKMDAVKAVTFQFSKDEALTASRADKESSFEGLDLADNESVKTADIESYLRQLTSLYFNTATAFDHQDAVDAKANSKKVVVTLFDDTRYTFTLGRRPEKNEAAAKEAADKTAETDAESEEPETITIPAGPVYIFIESSDPEDAIHAYTSNAAFSFSEYSFTSYPESRAALIMMKEAPVAPEATAEAESPAETSNPK